MSELLKGVQLQKNDEAGSTVDGEEALQDKLVALYFSGHWCGPCRLFTPKLKEFYNKLKEDGENFEIVYVSSDQSDEEMKEYLEEHGEWYVISFDHEMADVLSDKYEVLGIPTLVVIKPDGTLITKDGKSDVIHKEPKECLDSWKNRE